ncbi:MAG: GntR family transcriptional regulator [Peptococcaceae bacterium]
MNHKNTMKPEIGRKTLSNQVYDYLKQAIIFQEIPQVKIGTKLNESELASLLGVSLTPLREALNMLRKEGFVVGNSFQGSTVINFSLEDIENIFELREILELAVIRQAYKNFGEEDYLYLEQILSEYEQAYYELDFKQISAINQQFHNYLAEKSSNKWLKNTLDSIVEYLILVRAPLMKKRKESKEFDTRRAVTEHKEIVSSLKGKDLKKAEDAMKRHINRLKQEIINFNKENNK